ncbi:hypothetical protein NC651_037676 [Populus alba x Populus x berolinensis]|nr:hypothetical protein NC651_037676 [Populus alba x Populus x berolinensis]
MHETSDSRSMTETNQITIIEQLSGFTTIRMLQYADKLNKIKRQANNSEQPNVYQFINDKSSHTASQGN